MLEYCSSFWASLCAMLAQQYEICDVCVHPSDRRSKCGKFRCVRCGEPKGRQSQHGRYCLKLEWSDGFHIPEIVLKEVGIAFAFEPGNGKHHNLTPTYMQLLHLKFQFPLLCWIILTCICRWLHLWQLRSNGCYNHPGQPMHRHIRCGCGKMCKR